jgi:hypothetical protein
MTSMVLYRWGECWYVVNRGNRLFILLQQGEECHDALDIKNLRTGGSLIQIAFILSLDRLLGCCTLLFLVVKPDLMNLQARIRDRCSVFAGSLGRVTRLLVNMVLVHHWPWQKAILSTKILVLTTFWLCSPLLLSI